MTNLVWLLFKPSHLALYALIAGGVFARFAFGRRLLFAAILWLALLCVVPVGGLMLAPLEERFARPAALDRVDGIIVLAGAEQARLSLIYGEPQFARYTDRLTSFLMLAHRFPNARLIHTGKGTDSDVSQSDPARTLILGTGIDARRVLFEDRSRNTCESAGFAREQASPDPAEQWLLVTSAFHVPRAVACFRAVGWNVVPYPTDYKRGPVPLSFSLVDNLTNVDLAAHEWLGLVYYRLRGFTHELLPAPDTRTSND